MPVHIFYISDPLVPGICLIRGQEALHAAQVLRLRPGDEAAVFDGKGNIAQGIVETASRDCVAVRVESVAHTPLPHMRLTVATAIPKGKRWQFLIEKVTELGADVILPIITERSVAKGEGSPKRWEQWTVAAAKQSRRSRLPEIRSPVHMQDVLACCEKDDLLLVADPQGEYPAKWIGALGNAESCLVLVGPEGGFTDMELSQADLAGARRVRLTPGILRTETAAIAACTVIRGWDMDNEH